MIDPLFYFNFSPQSFQKNVDFDVFFLNSPNFTDLLINVNSEYCLTEPSLLKVQVLLWH